MWPASQRRSSQRTASSDLWPHCGRYRGPQSINRGEMAISRSPPVVAVRADLDEAIRFPVQILEPGDDPAPVRGIGADERVHARLAKCVSMCTLVPSGRTVRTFAEPS